MHLRGAAACSSVHRMSPMMMARRGGVGMLIPDVPWYESSAPGWAGSLPNQEEGMGHGVLEQIFIDGSANGLSWFGLFLSLRATLPLLNGLIFPKAPETITDQLYPFLQLTCNRYLGIFQRIFPYNINGVDLAVFPAFVSVLFLMQATEAVGKCMPGKGGNKRAKMHPWHSPSAAARRLGGSAPSPEARQGGAGDRGILEALGKFGRK